VDEEARIAGSLIRFTGVLREDHWFAHVPAWETSWVFDRPEPGDGSYVVDLLDEDGKVLSRASPRIEFRPPEDPEGGGLWLAEVLAYVPVHPRARALLFRRLLPDALEIHRAELAGGPPMVANLVVERADEPLGQVSLSWTSEHDRPIAFTVFFWPDGRAPIALASGLEEDRYLADGAGLPGPVGRFAVVASDGYRSSVAVGEPLDGFSVTVRMRITAPLTGEVLPPDQPVSLAAGAEDVAAQVAAVDQVTWLIDRETVAQGPVALVPAPEPGRHEVQAIGDLSTAAVEPDTVTVTVAERSAAQDERARRLADLPPLEERRRQTGW
jgi:hypothetical protein